MTKKPPLLQINQVTMRFGGILALENVNFSIAEDTITALIGPNGAGKTTVFNCATGVYRPTSGDILLKKEDGYLSVLDACNKKISKLDGWLIFPFMVKKFQNLFRGSFVINRLGVARTFQNMRLFKGMTLVENILVAQHLDLNWNLVAGILNTKSYAENHKKATEKAYHWLERLQLADDAQKLAGALPYGKARKLEIARAMCTNPRLICLDEPAAGLNPSETEELSRTILSLKKEYPITVFLIEHDMSMVMKISDHIVVLDHGVVIAEGNPASIKNNQKVIDAYLGKE